jgi:hypothetical protein
METQVSFNGRCAKYLKDIQNIRSTWLFTLDHLNHQIIIVNGIKRIINLRQKIIMT